MIILRYLYWITDLYEIFTYLDTSLLHGYRLKITDSDRRPHFFSAKQEVEGNLLCRSDAMILQLFSEINTRFLLVL